MQARETEHMQHTHAYTKRPSKNSQHEFKLTPRQRVFRENALCSSQPNSLHPYMCPSQATNPSHSTGICALRPYKNQIRSKQRRTKETYHNIVSRSALARPYITWSQPRDVEKEVSQLQGKSLSSTLVQTKYPTPPPSPSKELLMSGLTTSLASAFISSSLRSNFLTLSREYNSGVSFKKRLQSSWVR